LTRAPEMAGINCAEFLVAEQISNLTGLANAGFA
jgi:hypothetical protein